MSVLDRCAAIKTHVLYDMTAQVLREFKEQTDVGREIQELLDFKNEYEQEITVHRWWLVSDDFAYAAIACGEFVVETPFGVIWGCQASGQLIALDDRTEGVLKLVGVI